MPRPPKGVAPVVAATDEWAALDATAQAELVRSGQASAEELVTAAVERIRALDPTLGVLVDERFDRAVEESRGALPDGPFRGVPFLLKDAVQLSAGDRYQHGLRLLRDHPWRAPSDTELAARYRRAGLVFLGRTKVPEMTLSSTTEPLAHGPTYNPWDVTRSPGGSSGGSAAAVAAGLVPMAHGNDMGGSIRMPASCCGLVGLKPSRFRSPLGPERSEYWGPLTFEHVLTRSVRDSAVALDATAGPALGDMHMAPPPARPWAEEVGVDPGRLRVGYVAEVPGGPAIDPACRAAAERAVRLLEGLGHNVEPLAGDFLSDAVGRPAMSSIVAAGCAYELDIWERRVGATADELEPRVAEMIERGRAMTAVDYVRSVDEMGAWGRRIVEATAGVDVVVTPMMGVLPPKIGAIAGENMDVAYMYAMALFSVPFNVSGQPAVSLPFGTADGVPTGVQFVAAPNREDVLFRLAAQIEQAAPWPLLAPTD